ncbi:MAG: ATP-binding protein [Nitrospirae bacterium]|nr:ATP-binding protein [Nitrospirota bacterium]
MADTGKIRVTIKVLSHPRYLALVRTVTVTVAEISGMPKSVREHVKLAVDEACANVIRHAYRGDSGKNIGIRYEVSEKGFEVVIDDEGLKAAPEKIKGRDLSKVKPGGLGTHFIRRAFDIVKFDARKKKGNRLHLVRQRKDGKWK